MPISFTAAERKAITRRQIRIALENSGFALSIAAFAGQSIALLQVDVANTVFYDFYNGIVEAYEGEGRKMNGLIPSLYTGADIISNAQTPNLDPFFPMTPAPSYIRNLPLIQDGTHTNNKVKGFFHPTGTDARYEQNILSNGTVYDGLTEMIFRLNNGISGGGATTTTTTAISAGVQTGVVLTVAVTTGFSNGELVYINNGAASGIYLITGIVPATSITVSSVVHTQTGIASGATIKNTVAAFTNTERENLTSSLYQEILTNITNRILSLISEWETNLNFQVTFITGNDDDRATQVTQNTAALADVNNAKSIIDIWQALASTGVGAKYTSVGIAPISAEITARATFISARLAEIATALGGTSGDTLFQSGDTFGTNSAGNPYFNRYKWLNFRINRASGSLRRYYAATQSQGAVQELYATNVSLQSEYDSYFLTKSVVFNDGSAILHIKDLAGLAPSDSLTVVSETQPEISRTIVSLMGTTQIQLNAPVPKTYKTDDIARIFKTL